MDELKAKNIFVAVLDLPDAEQQSFLDRECAGDAELRARLEQLRANCETAACSNILSPLVQWEGIPKRFDNFGHYEEITRLGYGGMGVVYKAYNKHFGGPVALKMILPEYRDNPTIVALFQAEARNMARLMHLNLVPIHEVGYHQESPYFTMPLIEGGSLQALLPKLQQDARQAAQLLLAVAQAVHYAHQRGVIHRDLKPANILLDGLGRPIVTDFGLAVHLPSASEAIRGGTLGYMAPEQEEGKEATTLSDVYGLGAVLYAMLTGGSPPKKPTPLRLLNRRVDPDLEAICMKCLEREPARRYTSAEGLVRDLEAWLGGREATVPGWTWPYRLWRYCKRNAVLSALAVAAVVILGLVDCANSHARLRERERQVVESNAYTAQSVANTFDARLQHWSWAVLHESRNEELRAALAAKDGASLKKQLVAIRDYYSDPANGFTEGDKSCPFAGWFVLDGSGKGLAHSDSDQLGINYATRDYFQGALRTKPGSVYVSRVYHSVLADRYYKFAIAVPIYNGKTLLGVLATAILTDSAKKTLLPGEAPQKAVLVGRWDGNPAPKEIKQPAYTDKHQAGQRLILIHPDFVRGDRAVEINDEVLFPGDGEVPRVDEFYQDPVAKAEGRDGGRWLAASAPVERTEFVVLVQQEYGEAVRPVSIIGRPLILWGIVLVAFLVCAEAMIRSALVRNRLPDGQSLPTHKAGAAGP